MRMIKFNRYEEKFTKSVIGAGVGFTFGYLWGRYVRHCPPFLYGKISGIDAFAHLIFRSFLPSVLRGSSVCKIDCFEIAGDFLITVATTAAIVFFRLMCPTTAVAALILRGAWSTCQLWRVLSKPAPPVCAGS